LDEAAWLRRRNAMGIVRRLGRDPVRLSNEAGEREGLLGSSEPVGVGRLPLVGSVI
jgi:hypothetical protein